MEPALSFKCIEIRKTEVLGVGAYGTVYKALCDDLSCAAKVLHPELILDEQQQNQMVTASNIHRLPIRRFFAECEVLSRIRHPNVILFLGTSQDPATNLPVLLMELMDSNLTVFLNPNTPILFHTQVNICHDISLALSFLHSNSIIHRDLSSNNVLMSRDGRAKVTDFGMAIFEDAQRKNTRTPGTAVYMPPEIKRKDPISCDKTDVFSFGVLCIQIMTREFPAPIEDFSSNSASLWSSIVGFEPEVEKRQNHISLIEKGHPLLSIALSCLKYKYKNRPTSSELCRQVGDLKHRSFATETPTPVQEEEQQRQSDREKRQNNRQPSNTSGQNYSRSEFGRLVDEIGTCNVVDETWEEIDIQEAPDLPFTVPMQLLDISDTVRIKWLKRGQKSPQAMHRTTDCVVLESDMYILHGLNRITLYSFDPKYHKWCRHTNPPVEQSSLAVVSNKVVTVGGRNCRKLYSLIDEVWENKLPSMSKKRHCTITASSASHLVVVGGVGKNNKYLTTVEVLDIDSHRWSTVADIPEPCASISAKICERKIYVLGNLNSVFSCELDTLVDSKGLFGTVTKEPVWDCIQELPVSSATCVVFDKTLYAVGGKFSHGKPTTAVYRYNPVRSSWCVVSHLNLPRSQCLAAVVNKTMVVVGGITESGRPTDTVETATWRSMIVR